MYEEMFLLWRKMLQVSDTYRGIGKSIGRYLGILILGIGGIAAKPAIFVLGLVG
jgi:hypothetical protein